MTQPTPELNQDIINLYDEYTHVPLERRDFMRRLATLAGGTAAAYALLPLLENNYAHGAMVDPGDTRLHTQRMSYQAPDGWVDAYLAEPAERMEALPALIIVHENRGLNPHIEDVARRAALAGYMAIAPDFLSPLGGTPDDEDRARSLFGELDAGVTLANARELVTLLAGYGQTTGAVGAVGFCWGGGLVNNLVVNEPELDAACAFYGAAADMSGVDSVSTPVLLHYAGLDDRINAGRADYVAALKGAGASVVEYLYAGVNHAFHNDTNAARYDAEAADLAWRRTLAFFDINLR